MFGFLNSTVLFAAAAALIPLIIHLFSKRRVKIVEFSSLKHLRAMQKRQVRRLKIRQLLLLIVRMLLILTVVLAFARPTTKTGGVGAHASVSAVILFDNSASLGRYVSDGNLFEITKSRTDELLKTFGQSDEIILLPLVRSASYPEQFGSSATAKTQLDQISQSAQKADIQSALETAARRLNGSSNLNREIYIITDLQRNSLPSSDSVNLSGINQFLVDLPLETDDNIGIISVDFGGQLVRPGVDFNISATIKNYGSKSRSDILASLYLDGRRVQQTQAEVPLSGENKVRFTQSVAGTGFHSGYVELSDDKFLADNKYYFSFNIPEQFSMLIVDGDPSAQFIELAMTPNQEITQAWSVKKTLPEQLNSVNLRDYDLIMLCGTPKLDPQMTERIKNLVRQGKALFITYGANTDITDFNNSWSEVSGVVFDQPLNRTFSREGYYSLLSIDLSHPMFTVFGFEKEKLPEIKFFTLPNLHTIPEAKTLISFTGNRPALVEYKFGAGRVLTFTGPMAPEYTDLPGHAFFVPFISRAAEYLASDLSTLDIHLFAGTAISRTFGFTGSISSAMQLIGPDSSITDVTPDEKSGSLVVQSFPTDIPGIYSIRYQGRELDRFAINIDPQECDLNRVDPDQFGSAIGVRDLRELKVGESLEPAIAGFRFGRELWPIFAWIAVLLLAAEMLLSRSNPIEE